MRALQRPQDHGHLVKLVVLAFERQLVRGEAIENELECFVIDLCGLREVDSICAGLERRHAPPDSEFEAPAAHLIEHADFLDQAQRMIERQEIDKWAEAQALGALRQRGEEQSRRGGAAERRRVVFGEVIAIDAAAIVGFDQLKSIGIELRERTARVVHVIEYAELHGNAPRDRARPPGLAPLAASRTASLSPLDLFDFVGLGPTWRHHLDACALALADERAGEW